MSLKIFYENPTDIHNQQSTDARVYTHNHTLGSVTCTNNSVEEIIVIF